MPALKNSADYGGITEDLRKIYEDALKAHIPDMGLFKTFLALSDESPKYEDWIQAWYKADPSAKASWTMIWWRIRKGKA